MMYLNMWKDTDTDQFVTNEGHVCLGLDDCIEDYRQNVGVVFDYAHTIVMDEITGTFYNTDIRDHLSEDVVYEQCHKDTVAFADYKYGE